MLDTALINLIVKKGGNRFEGTIKVYLLVTVVNTVQEENSLVNRI